MDIIAVKQKQVIKQNNAHNKRDFNSPTGKTSAFCTLFLRISRFL